LLFEHGRRVPQLEISREPLRTIYVLMTSVFESAVEAQERGDVQAAAALAGDAAVLGRAIEIVARHCLSDTGADARA
jgi:hypothetical protein